MFRFLALFSFIFLSNAAFSQESELLTDEQAIELGMTYVGDEASDEKAFMNARTREKYLLQDSDLDLAEVVIVINKGKRSSSNKSGQTIRAYKNGVFLHEFDTSTGTEQSRITTTGRRYVATTPAGIFRPKSVYKKYQSYAFTGARMDYATFFQGGIAIHSTTKSHYPELGQRDSGGCARLKYEDAQTIADLIRSTGEGHEDTRDESFSATKNGRRIKLDRIMYTDREKRENLERFSGRETSSVIWTYNAAIIVVTEN